METEKRLVSNAILDLLEWTDNDRSTMTDYEQGIVMGLKIAQCIACEVEYHGES